MKQLISTYLGCTEYKEIWDLQKQLFDLRTENRIPDILLLNEHNHVYTIGKSGNGNHLLATEEELLATGAEVFYTDRGGDITYHGPGQLVGYPILDLNNYYLDTHKYLRDIEETLILTLKDFQLQGTRSEGMTGVWVGNNKIAAIGIKISRWITMHGFAFNVNTDLSYFDRIIPCGIFHKGVTSLQQVLGHSVDIEEVNESIISNLEKVFGVETSTLEKEDFIKLITEQIRHPLANGDRKGI
ncbi:MAG: lipoyl(octanoyl) transferase LipB [Bacteroidota bacterium]|nr:lipoyl(octanoyl) transferase LipB [Bacteroidota bacterium]